MRTLPPAAPPGVVALSPVSRFATNPRPGVDRRPRRRLLRAIAQRTAWAVALTLGAANASHALIISSLQLAEGNTSLQVTGAVANTNPGGQASAATRTLYVFAPDFGDLDNGDAGDDGPDFPNPNTGPNPNGPWPWVYALDASQFTLGDLVIEAGITADFDLRTNSASGAGLQWLYVNDNPTYQFIGDGLNADPAIPLDQGSSLANGNFGPWNYVQLDGTPTQSRVPVPSTLVLLMAGLFAVRRLAT